MMRGVIVVFFIVIINHLVFAQLKQDYRWQSVAIGGGGFVDGIVFHPNQKGLCYCRTDMGGAYRRDTATGTWIPLLDWVSSADNNLMGVESIALDPNNADILFMACGTYTEIKSPNAILISDNQGKTFKRVDVPFRMGGNENGRGNGERMAVDPLNGNIIYMGTRIDGLWRSVNKGLNWERVESFPDVTEDTQTENPWSEKRGSGIVFVMFDSRNASKPSIYVGVSLKNRSNLYRSSDSGKTWEAIGGQPLDYRPTHAALALDGNLYITYGSTPGPTRMTNGAVWKLNTQSGQWLNVTPDAPDSSLKKRFGYAAVSVDARNPQTLVVSTYGRPSKAGGDEIFLSTDGGASWKTLLNGRKSFDYSLAPYVAQTPVHWMFDLELDPFDSNHLMFTTGYGGHESFNVLDVEQNKPVVWSLINSGIEETVALELLSPPKGPWLLSAIGDYCGFVHNELDKSQPEGCYTNPHFSNSTSVDCAWKNPDIMLRVGVKSYHHASKSIGYTLDGGKTWSETLSLPTADSKLGNIAVSAKGDSWVWTPDNAAVYVTSNKGTSWKPSVGIPAGIRVIADREASGVFYGMDLFGGKLYTSVDSGNSFSESKLVLPEGLPLKGERGDIRGGQDRIYATPGYKGELWIAAFDGLYRSTNAGKVFVKLRGVTEMNGFGFGKEAPGSTYPALYMIGKWNGVHGIFRSDDLAQTWIRINDDQHQWGLLLHISGDPKKYGRVYIGTHGRGIIFGDID